MTGYVVSNVSFGAQTSGACMLSVMTSQAQLADHYLAFMIGDSFIPVVNTWETSNGFFSSYNELFRFSNQGILQQLNSLDYCHGVCYSHMQAIGFEVDCVDTTNHTDIAIPAIAAYNANGNASAWTDLPIFNSSFAVEYASETTNYSQIVLDLQYFQSDDPYNPTSDTCPGTVFRKQCSLRPAIISYPLKITNFTNEHVINGVSLGTKNAQTDDPDLNKNVPLPKYDGRLKQAEGFSVVEYLYPQDTHTMRSLTALGGIANALSQFLSSSAAITYEADGSWSLKQLGTLAQTMMYGPPNMGSCDCSFRNEALDSIVASINQLTFLVATGMVDTSTFRGLPRGKTAFPSPLPQASVIAVDSNTTTSFRALSGQAIQLTDVVHYRTHYVYAGLAFGITIFCILLVIPSFWQYGELGRRVTLGPVEIASAFGAPILVDNARAEARNENIDTLIKHIGHRKIVYGFVDVDGDGQIDDHQEMHLQGTNQPGLPTTPGLAVTSPGLQTPTLSPALSQTDGQTSTVQKRRSVRLAMGAPERVRPTSQVCPQKNPRLVELKE